MYVLVLFKKLNLINKEFVQGGLSSQQWFKVSSVLTYISNKTHVSILGTTEQYPAEKGKVKFWNKLNNKSSVCMVFPKLSEIS